MFSCPAKDPVTTYTYDDNGNLTKVQGPSGNPTTMEYDKENRLAIVRINPGALNVYTYTYSGDGPKRAEVTSLTWTTLVWDGSDYIQERT